MLDFVSEEFVPACVFIYFPRRAYLIMVDKHYWMCMCVCVCGGHIRECHRTLAST